MEAEMALLSCEVCVSRSLRRILSDLPIGASLYDLVRPQPEQTGDFFPCLEYFLPAVLGEIHPEWQRERVSMVFYLFSPGRLDQERLNSLARAS